MLADEVYAVPFVIEEEGSVFLKTAYPSRKARKLLLSDCSTINKLSLADFITNKD